MDRFSKLNPLTCFLFFLCILAVNMLVFNPYYLAVCLVGGVIYTAVLKGVSAVIKLAASIIPLVAAIGIFNMLFVNRGATVLFTLFNRSFSLEALVYGLTQGIMLSGVIVWILNYSYVMTDDKFLSVFTRVAPQLSLLFSMTLSFIPRLRKNAAEINDATACINCGSKLGKAVRGFSALVSITLEESIETAQSMKARGYSSHRRSYSKYKFSAKDGVITLVALALTVTVIVCKIKGETLFIFEPFIDRGAVLPVPIISCAILSFLPFIIDLEEDIRWFCLKQRA